MLHVDLLSLTHHLSTSHHQKMSPFEVIVALLTLAFDGAAFVGSDSISCVPNVWRESREQCLSFVLHSMEDESEFWFGKDFQASGCGYERFSNFSSFVTDRDPNCVNERPKPFDKYLTLGSRIFSNNQYRSLQYMKQLEGLFEVQFNSPPENYRGCNSSGELLSTTIFDVYPEMPALPAVLVRYPPILKPTGCNLPNLCTIILYDAGHGVVHNVWPNWPKRNDISNYVHPSHGSFDPNPYVFMAFRQKGEINFTLTPHNPWTFNVSSFTVQFNLEGPVAINWMKITTDLTAQESLIEYQVVNNCPEILQHALTEDRSFIGIDLGSKNVDELHAWLYVKYETDSLIYDGCCGKREIKNATVWLDPVRNGIVEPENVRIKPQISIFPRLYYFPNSKDMQGQTFLLLLIHSEAFIVDSKTSNLKDVGVFVHWCRTNIANGDTNTGKDIRPYIEPFPMASRSSNRFYYLLYKQEGNLANSFDDYFDNSTCIGSRFSDRCGFSLNQFVIENQLTLWGLSRFRLPENAIEFPFVQYLRAKYLLTNEQDCLTTNCNEQQFQ